MRLVPKLALTLLAGVFSVLAVFTTWRVRGEVATFDHEVRRDHRMVGLTAAAAVSKTRTREDAMRLVHRIDDASRERIGIRFISLMQSPEPKVAPLIDLAPEQVPEPGAWIQLERRLPRQGSSADYLVTYVGAPVVDDPLGAIQLEESLEPRAAYVSRGVWSALASSVAMMFVCAIIVASAGVRLVGKPVSELLVAVRQIGAGDFDVLGAVRRSDEFGELARALRAMSVELEAARSRAELEVEARITALQQLRHAERLTTLGQLASVLAHEIGTPLNVIAGHAKMVASGRMVGEHARESCATIGSQCERMTQIVQRILDYARRKPSRRLLIDAADVMHEARGLLSGLAARRDVTLVFECNGDRSELFADPDQLQQAVVNLVMNAIQASKPGAEVRLSVAAETHESATDPPTEYVVLLVQDRGAGMSNDSLSRVFEPFFTTKPPGEGTGLGLSVVREIVSEHGGFVKVESRENEGSTFRLCLPRGSADARSRISH